MSDKAGPDLQKRGRYFKSVFWIIALMEHGSKHP